MYSKDQLCFSCSKCIGKCSWSKNFIPVDGWVAVQTTTGGSHRKIKTFNVLQCPEYEFDGTCLRCKYNNKFCSVPEEWYKYCQKFGFSQGRGDCSGFVNKYAKGCDMIV